jgi:pyruvate/2-oxoglutarate dehydrogenase complex dihydrolipoamide acyltransferase (E2) component
MSTPLELPDLGTEGDPVVVSGWLVDVGDRVEAGDRVVEVLVTGITFDVTTPVAGTIERIAIRVDDLVPPGGVLAWIAPEAGP